MKLSDAIRLGAMIRPQEFGSLLSTYTYPPSAILGLDRSYSRSCALGAAMEAAGITPDSSPCAWGKFYSAFGSVLYRVLIEPCPVCAKVGVEESNTVAHLNNDHRWTRQQIADWVATIETLRFKLAQPLTLTVTA